MEAEELRNIISDAMDGFAEAVMRGGETNVSDHVDALTKKLTPQQPSEGEIEIKKNRKGFIRMTFPENDIRFMQDHGFWMHIPAGVKFVAELTGNDSVRLVGEGYGALRDNPYGLKYDYGNGAIYVLLSDLPAKTVAALKELTTPKGEKHLTSECDFCHKEFSIHDNSTICYSCSQSMP